MSLPDQQELDIKEVLFEPGRSIVANAGVTLYTVGSVKKIQSGSSYVFVDGGMSDNIRPALYQAKYACDIANNMNALKTNDYIIACRLCESGDVLIRNTSLGDIKRDDIIVVYSTGAYGYSMSSNYNKQLRPAIVFVKDKTHRLVVRREELRDLIAYDV